MGPMQVAYSGSGLQVSRASSANAAGGTRVDIEIGGARPKREPDAPAPPDRAQSLRRSRAKRLQRTDRDQFGVPVPSTSRDFTMLASPAAIAESCTGTPRGCF